MASDIPQGYLPPDEACRQAMEFRLDNDPLVNDPRNGIGGTIQELLALVPAAVPEAPPGTARCSWWP